MFRAAPRVRSIARPLCLYRPPPRANLSRLVQPGEAFKTQPVRFLPPPRFSPLRIATFALYSTCFLGYIWYFFPEIEIEIQEVPLEEEEGDAVISDSEYADDDSLFIPLTWAKKLPRTFYKGSDPEWQEFVKLSKDRPRHKRIQAELVDIVFQASLKHPLFSKQLGPDAKVGNCWLDIVFPDGPPQEYARGGIEVGNGFVAYSVQRVSALDQHRINRTLWPTSAFNGLYSSTKLVLLFQYHRLKELLGWQGEPAPGSTEAKYKQLLQLLQAQQQNTEAKAQASGTSDAASPEKPQSASASSFPWAARVPQPPSSVDMPIAQHVLNAHMQNGKMPKKMEAPRGTFVVQGLVQLKGSRSIATLDVHAFYDPKSSHFVVVNATPRSMKRTKQSPRGGQ